MQRTQRRRAHATRRAFLGSLGLAAAGLGAASQSSAATDTASGPDSTGQFVVEQGDQCVPVVPLSGDVPVEERYGWAVEGADFSATGLVDLQRPDTSILFLYDGPSGLSLVVVHEKYGDGTDGGSATFEFAGLPSDGEWVVRDDYYDGESNFDQWTRDGTEATVDWTWADSRTDGGAFRGLGTDPDLEIRIDPSYNDEAALSGEYYDGELTDWEVLSESADGPTRTALALDEPVVVRRGTCSNDGTRGNADDSEDSDRTTERSDDSEGSDGDADDESVGERQDTAGSDSADEDAEGDREDDDHPGKGMGHVRGRGKGHENGQGKGHERHGDDRDDESEQKRGGEDEGNGRGKNRGRGNGR